MIMITIHRLIDMNRWIGYCRYPEQANRLNAYIINKHKMHRNLYSYVESCHTFMLKGKELHNSLTTPGKMTSAGTAILKEQADAQ